MVEAIVYCKWDKRGNYMEGRGLEVEVATMVLKEDEGGKRVGWHVLDL